MLSPLARIGASISPIACGVDGDEGDTCRWNISLSPHVPYFMPHCKVPCQDRAPHTLQILTQVVGRMLPSRCRWQISLARHGASGASRNRGAKTAPFLERFPLGAATSVTPAWTGPWLRLDLGPARYRECWFHRCFQPIVAISLDVTGARATAVGLRVAPSRLVSPARCCCGGFWAATHLHPRSPSFMSLDSFGVSVDC